MSHTVKVSTQLKNKDRLQKICQKWGIECEVAKPGQKLKGKLFSGEVDGVAKFKLKEWKYPVVIDENGNAQYDNYNGSWGAQEYLDKFQQDYAHDTVVEEALAQGFRIVQESNVDGSLELLLQK